MSRTLKARPAATVAKPYEQGAEDSLLDMVLAGSAIRSAIAAVPLAIAGTIVTLKYLSLSLLWALPVYSVWGIALLALFTTVGILFDQDAGDTTR